MEQIPFVAIVGGSLLLLGAGTYLLIRRATPGVSLRDPAVVSAVAIFVSVLHILLAVIYWLDGRLIWQGALHVALAVGWLVLRRLNSQTVRT